MSQEVKIMKGYKNNLEMATQSNHDFRKVEFTGSHSQLVLMSLKPGEEIGEEVHEVDQFFRFESGLGKVIIDADQYEVADGDAVVVPAGSKHNVINTSKDEDLKLYTIYSPSQHPDGTVHHTKADADKAEALEHGA